MCDTNELTVLDEYVLESFEEGNDPIIAHVPSKMEEENLLNGDQGTTEKPADSEEKDDSEEKSASDNTITFDIGDNCFAWNMSAGVCNRGEKCRFEHVCFLCNDDHPYKKCPQFVDVPIKFSKPKRTKVKAEASKEKEVEEKEVKKPYVLISPEFNKAADIIAQSRQQRKVVVNCFSTAYLRHPELMSFLTQAIHVSYTAIPAVAEEGKNKLALPLGNLSISFLSLKAAKGFVEVLKRLVFDRELNLDLGNKRIKLAICEEPEKLPEVDGSKWLLPNVECFDPIDPEEVTKAVSGKRGERIIYLSGLPPDFDGAELKAAFPKALRLEPVFPKEDEEKPKDIAAFVEFKTIDDAEKFLNKFPDGIKHQDRLIIVQPLRFSTLAVNFLKQKNKDVVFPKKSSFGAQVARKRRASPFKFNKSPPSNAKPSLLGSSDNDFGRGRRRSKGPKVSSNSNRRTLYDTPSGFGQRNLSSMSNTPNFGYSNFGTGNRNNSFSKDSLLELGNQQQQLLYAQQQQQLRNIGQTMGSLEMFNTSYNQNQNTFSGNSRSGAGKNSRGFGSGNSNYRY